MYSNIIIKKDTSEIIGSVLDRIIYALGYFVNLKIRTCFVFFTHPHLPDEEWMRVN